MVQVPYQEEVRSATLKMLEEVEEHEDNGPNYAVIVLSLLGAIAFLLLLGWLT